MNALWDLGPPPRGEERRRVREKKSLLIRMNKLEEKVDQHSEEKLSQIPSGKCTHTPTLQPTCGMDSQLGPVGGIADTASDGGEGP